MTARGRNVDRDQGRYDSKSLLRCDILQQAGVAELADAQDLKSWVPQGACGFDPRPRHKPIPIMRGFRLIRLRRFGRLLIRLGSTHRKNRRSF
jgi:hypothetical protein